MTYAASLSGWYVYEDAVHPQWASWQDALNATVRMPARSLAAWSRFLAGPDPYTHRAVSLTWHLLNGVLVWLVAKHVLSSAGAVMALAVFLLLPIQTESVAYISSQPELIAATGVLLALLATSRGRLGLACVCAMGAMAGKELAAPALFLVPLWAWWTGQRWSRAWITAWAVTVCGVGLIGFWLATSHVLLASYWPPTSWYIAGQIATLTRLLALIPESVVRADVLTIDHDWGWLSKPAAVCAVMVWLGALETAWRFRWPAWGFALLWTLTALSVRLIVPLPDGLHERHLYTPMVAWSLAIGAAVFPKESV